MKKGYFVTGFPGFLSEQLLKLWLNDNEDKHIYLLVLPSMVTKAGKKMEELKSAAHNNSTIQMIEGDITKENLGLPGPTLSYLTDKITYVWHLAAIYDLAVDRSIAFKVNVTGTYHLNEWIQKLTGLKRYVYFSTAYVAGKREGVLKADELVRPREFHNFYEETKYEAEVLVESLKNKLPVTIIRPSIVKGTVTGGETSKFDGAYYMMNIIDNLKLSPVIPYIGKSSARLNIVPSDYVVRAANWLGHSDSGEGKTYHITDPNPYPSRELFRFVMLAQIGRKPVFTIPASFAEKLLSFSQARKLLKVEKQAVTYFNWHGRFDQTDTEKDLAGSQISCPDFLDGIGPMVRFYEQNKRNKALHPPVV
ncbi:SDR family oxidoreductase [Jeotgalibacillus proteolyticus]|uniref:3-beta hydroxysteroid dehydrogenase n=1 Tax=Jeotgalibacillus proteolyticus TaxID=2082395 RepID=A0A2S5GGT4_9BACL|nr:SDR family oxidoreductase [Jeotgalibacillus proteolyticus]PPA72252.1 3-beta hydroxysteroid dehydrogenase [Jeotgalibacillus proteolyticus]